jgi:hypothetical protein
MLGKTFGALVAGALLFAAAPASAATTIDFTTGSGSATDGSDGNIRSFSAGGITVQASAWSYYGSALHQSWLGDYSHGLGVTNPLEGSGSSGNSHTVDNYGGQRDFVVLIFNQSVRIESAVLYPFDVDPASGTQLDNDALVSFATLMGAFTTPATALTTGSPVWGSLSGSAYDVAGNLGAGYSTSFASAGKYGNVWIIGASDWSLMTNPDRYYDGFKISSILVSKAVPEPATWAMMLFGFGAMGLALRRRPARLRAA